MTNYIQQGHVIDVVAPVGGYTSGDLVVVGTLVGIANTTVLAGEKCAISVEGVFEIPKLTGALSVGAKVYSDAGAAVDTTNTDTLVGKVVEAALSGDTTVKVLLVNA